MIKIFMPIYSYFNHLNFTDEFIRLRNSSVSLRVSCLYISRMYICMPVCMFLCVKNEKAKRENVCKKARTYVYVNIAKTNDDRVKNKYKRNFHSRYFQMK